MPKITKDTTLAEVLKEPSAKQILAKHNVPCVTCPMAKFEMDQLQLGHICEMYSIDCDKLVNELNNIKK